jgi:hypothetical protein
MALLEATDRIFSFHPGVRQTERMAMIQKERAPVSFLPLLLQHEGKQFTLTSIAAHKSASSTYQHLIIRSLMRGLFLFFMRGGHQLLLVATLHYFRGQIRHRPMGRFHLPVHHPLSFLSPSLYLSPSHSYCCLPQPPQNAALKPLSSTNRPHCQLQNLNTSPHPYPPNPQNPWPPPAPPGSALLSPPHQTQLRPLHHRR